MPLALTTVILTVLCVATFQEALPVSVGMATYEMGPRNLVKVSIQMCSCTVYYVQLLSDVNECDRNPCGPNADCQNTPGSFVCKCDQGYITEDDGKCVGKYLKKVSLASLR